MKKSVYISGISCAILMMLGCLFKVMHWPGAGVMLILSVFLFCFFFLPIALKDNYENMPVKKYKTLHIVAFIVFFIAIMGVLFKAMHWPGAALFLFVGILLPFVLFLPVYLYQTREEEKAGNKNFFGITLGLTFLAVFGVLLALSNSKQVVWQAVESVDHNQADTKNYESKNKVENAITKSAEDLYSYVDELKCMLISSLEYEMCSGNKPNDNFNPHHMGWNMENRGIVKSVILSPDEGKAPASILKEKINSFHEIIFSTKNISPELADLVKELFYTGDEDRNHIFPKGIEWEHREFNNYSVIFTLDYLTRLQSNVRLVENEVLSL